MSKEAVEYDEVHRYLSRTDSKYADGCSESRKRAIRRFSARVILEDGILYYLQFSEKDKEQVTKKKQWVSDKQKQQQILRSLHDDQAGGCHFGRDKTREKVASRYYWSTMYEDVDDYIKTCEKCQKVMMHAVYII